MVLSVFKRGRPLARIGAPLAITTLLVLVGVVPAAAQRLDFELDETVSLDRYHSFDRESAGLAQEVDEGMRVATIERVERALRAAGLATDPGDPDLLLRVSYEQGQRSMIDGRRVGYGYMAGGFKIGLRMPVKRRTKKVPVAILTVELVDAATLTSVWRGRAEQGIVDDAGENERRRAEAVDGLMDNWQRAYRKARTVK